MTKKKQTNSSSSFEDFELDNEKLKKILDAENSPEFIDDYLNGFLNTVSVTTPLSFSLYEPAQFLGRLYHQLSKFSLSASNILGSHL